MRPLLIALVTLSFSSVVTATTAAPPGVATIAAASSPSPKKAEGSPDSEPTAAKPDLPEKKAAVEKQLRVAQQTLREANEDETTSSSSDAQRVDLLKQLNLLYTQQETALARTKELEAARSTTEQTLQELQANGPQEKKPYSFFLQESLQDSLTAQKARLKTAASTVESATQSLTRAKEAAESKDKKRRQAKEQLAGNNDVTLAAELEAAHESAKLESKLAIAESELRSTELVNAKLEQETAQLELQFVTEKLHKIELEITFSKKDLNKRLLELGKLESDITRRTNENDAEVSLLLSELEKARRRLDQAADPSSAQQTEVKSRWKTHNLRDMRREYFTTQSTWVQKLREIWNRRYRVATDQFESSELATWRTETESFLDLLAADKSLKTSRLEELRKELADAERQLAEEHPPEVKRWIANRGQAIREQIEFINDHIARGEATTRTAKKLAAEIRQRTSQFSVVEWAGVVWDKVVFVWDYELTKSENDEPPLRVSAVVSGLLLLALGYRFSRKLSRTLGARVLPRFGINEGGVAALEMLSFYALLFITTMMALKVVSVPLTMFTFLGGAAAIGVGFGSQNILNNFISGLILLTEQPVRVGDLIELNGLIGCVESIGLRSTRMRTGAMQEIIVPNSSFLENNVVNWTLSDTVLRCNVDVGVAYGSPTREVARWLKRAADEHGLVLAKPEPFVWFAAFGDNALSFELYFYITVRTLSERRRIESDLRFMVDQYFREAGISIAYPQRDLHLDMQRPLEVRMLPVEERSQPEALPESRAA